VGSIEARGPNTWRLIVSLGRDDYGRQVKATRTVHGGRREAERALERFAVELRQRDRRRAGGATLAEWIETWLADVESRLTHGTVVGYQQHLRDRILPHLGNVPLHELTPPRLHQWLRTVERAGRVDGTGAITQATLLRVFRTLSGCLQEAVYRGLLDSNPARNVKAPQPKRREASFYGPGEVQRLLAAAENEPLTSLRLLIRLALATGARRNELLALDWSAVRWSDPSLEIAWSVVCREGLWQRKPPKSGMARRVALDSVTIELMRHWQAEQSVARELHPGEWHGQDRIFTTTAGRWVTPYWVSHWFGRFVARHELPPLPFHGLRHTSASLMLAGGIPTGAAARVLGHSSPTITANIYGHVIEGAARQASDVLARHLAPKVSPNVSPTAHQSDGL
jgi:integrase